MYHCVFFDSCVTDSKIGGGGGGHWLVRSWMVSVSASVNLPLHYEVQKFFSGTGSPGWSQKKGHKMVVCVYVCVCVIDSKIFLWPPYVIGQAIIFLPCGFFLSSIFFFFLA